MHEFIAPLEIIGVNPFVQVPEPVLQAIFEQAKKDKGPIPICGTVNDKPYRQTLVKFAGAWRLYINLQMLRNSPDRIGETLKITVAFDPKDRTIEVHPKLKLALAANVEARAVFDRLPPSRQQEIVRYIARLKTEASRDRNIIRAINFLLGKERFIGRDKP